MPDLMYTAMPCALGILHRYRRCGLENPGIRNSTECLLSDTKVSERNKRSKLLAWACRSLLNVGVKLSATLFQIEGSRSRIQFYDTRKHQNEHPKVKATASPKLNKRNTKSAINKNMNNNNNIYNIYPS